MSDILGKNSGVAVWHAVLPPYSWKVAKLIRRTCKLHENSMYKYKINSLINWSISLAEVERLDKSLQSNIWYSEN